MTVSLLVEKTSFSAGELDPSLHGRTELARNATGVAICENMVVMVEGGLTRRPGTRFVTPLAAQAQRGLLVPFEFSADDAYMLIFNGGRMRVMRNGGVVEAAPGVPYELAVPFSEVHLDDLRLAQSGNVLFVAWPGSPKVITRLGHANWTIADYVNVRGPVDVQNAEPGRTLQANVSTGGGTLTANTPTFKPGHVGSIWRLDEGNLALIPTFKGNEGSIPVGAFRRNAGRVYQNVAGADAGPNAPTHDEGDVSAGSGNITWRFVHSGAGFAKITNYIGAYQVNFTAEAPISLSSVNGPTYRWYEAAWSSEKGWPTQVRLHDNRLVWTRGDQTWFTKIGDFYTFELTTDEDSAVATRLTSPDGKLVDIRWVLNSGVLVVGAASSEWMIRGTDAFSPILVNTIRAVPDGSEGSAKHRPALVDGGAVFIGRSRRRLHYAQFERISEKITVDELTLYARHILSGSAIDLDYARDPHRIVWIGQSSGELVGITFRPDQQVQGWHRHPMTNGVVENIGVLPSVDASVSETWTIVRRTVDGTVRRYVEVMQPFFQPDDIREPTASGAWFVDSGLPYDGAPVQRITGLGHLVGEEVAILADGIDHRRVVVDASGGVDLDRPVSKAVVGLPIRWRVRSLRMAPQVPNLGASQGSMVKADSVYVQRLYSAGGFVSVNGGEQEALLLTGGDPTGVPQPLTTGGQVVTTLSPIEGYLEVEIAGDDTYPFTLTGLSPHAQFMEAG